MEKIQAQRIASTLAFAAARMEGVGVAAQHAAAAMVEFRLSLRTDAAERAAEIAEAAVKRARSAGAV